jgi:hypothetical protein
MFIAFNTKKTIAPFGVAECYWMSTDQVEFRPSERRWIDGWTKSIKIRPLRGDQVAHRWLAQVTTSKKAYQKKQEVDGLPRSPFKMRYYPFFQRCEERE